MKYVILALALALPVMADERPSGGAIVALVELTECGAPVAIELVGQTGLRVYVASEPSFAQAVKAFKNQQELMDVPTMIVELRAKGCKVA